MYGCVLKAARKKSESTQKFPYKVKCGNASVTIYRVKHAKMRSGHIYSVAWYDSEGARRQRQFGKLADAQAEAKLKAEQLQAGKAALADLDASDARELQHARSIAGKGGIIPALEEWKRAHELCKGSILPACQNWADKNRPKIKPITVAEAIDLFVAFKMRKGVNVRSGYARTLPRLKSDLGDIMLANVSVNRLEHWLEQFVHPVTANTHRRRIVTLWRWARDKGYLSAEVKTAAELTETAQEGAQEIGIISAETFHALLRYILENHEHYLAPLALAGFCGLRRAEIQGQLWDDIELERGFVRISAAKRGTPARRLVPLCKEAVSWLSMTAQPAGEVCPGKTIAMDRIRDIGQTAGFVLPANCFRHAYISNRVALTGDINSTSLEAGNSPRIIHRHYRELVTKSEAQAWFCVGQDDSKQEAAQ